MSIVWTRFCTFELERNVKYIYTGIRRITYLKSGMGFNVGITFFNEDNGCWEMLKWVREGRIEVYVECIKNKGNDNINEVVESDDESESAKMEVEYSVVGGGYDKEDEDILQLEAESLHEREDYECSCQTSSSTDEDNAVSNDSNRPVSHYDDIDNDGVLTPLGTDEDYLFNQKERERQG